MCGLQAAASDGECVGVLYSHTTVHTTPERWCGLGLPPQHSTPTHLQKERRHPQPTSICFTYVTLLYLALYSNTLGKEPMQPFTVYCTQNRALRK